VTPAQAAQALAARDRALRLVVANQVSVDGARTGWCQQYDALSLAPAGARNFEPAALAAEESVGLLDFLRDQEPGARPAIVAATGWLKAHALHGVAWRPGADGHTLVQDAAADSLWSRYYSLATGRPIFGDRDHTVHDDVNQISRERREGYSWFTRRPCRAIAGCL
jgi:PelA/Pel-15E family pectate lyase